MEGIEAQAGKCGAGPITCDMFGLTPPPPPPSPPHSILSLPSPPPEFPPPPPAPPPARIAAADCPCDVLLDFRGNGSGDCKSSTCAGTEGMAPDTVLGWEWIGKEVEDKKERESLPAL